MPAAEGPGPAGALTLAWRPYAFSLPRALVTSRGEWRQRRGWLLRLQAADGRRGWGEAADLDGPAVPGSSGSGPSLQAREPGELERALARLPARLERAALEASLAGLPPPLACALGMALAELDGPGAGDWLTAPPSALLLPAGEAMEAALEEALAPPLAPGDRALPSSGPRPTAWPLTLKWKVATGEDRLERRLLEHLLRRLPDGARLRLDANGGWDRPTAASWAERLAEEPRLEWLEQPLPPADREGLEQLAARLPVALDESLRHGPGPAGEGWRGWQVRRPLAEGDPRSLLADLQAGTPRLMLSTALETGIGRRLLHHLAGLQALGPTPAAPGLAPGWRPDGPLFAADPETVWRAAAQRP